MSPRAYDMTRRDLVRERTRRRIVEATLELHTEKGILGTSWRDIARRADVAVATVYNHFPSLDELVPACGEHLMERLRPPAASDVDEIIGDARSVEERLGRVAEALLGFYERGGAHLRTFPGERELPAVREWEGEQRSTVETFVGAALAPARPSRQTLRLVSALFDLGTFDALRERGVGAKEAARAMTQAAACLSGGVEDPTTNRRRR